MGYKIISILLFVIIVAGGLFFIPYVSGLSEQIAILESDYLELESDYLEIATGYSDLQTSYNKLDEAHRTYVENYQALSAEYKKQQTDINELQKSYDYLEAKYDTLAKEQQKIVSENTDLKKLLAEYENVPHSYYSVNIFKQYSNTFNDLSRFLTFEFEIPGEYAASFFDCSESSAYLEWALENAGFSAEIVTGPSPSDESDEYHAWVIVHTTDYRVAIESTALFTSEKSVWLSRGRVPGIIYSNDSLIKEWENYYQGYERSFRNIYIAIRDSGKRSDEWNWWLGPFDFN
jgi:hypothetical protein